jgi:hypothetical protein
MLLLVQLPAACTDPPAGGLTGTAVVLDDTGRGDSPIGEGWIIAVPAAAVDELWSTTGNRAIDGQNLKSLTARVSQDQVTQAGGVVAALHDDGEFVLPAEQGEHLICYLETADVGGGEVIQGCGFLNLPASGELEVSDGEGGFTVGVKE